MADQEVAEDYLNALRSLELNSRYEISNLTVIAKENTEHALAIAEALKTHIKQVSPLKKLPAFYVLDSVVKNVGTPYTLFFGRGLYSTFMEAYALVDHGTRRKMDEMLKTWKEPVPGSMDMRPVFPPEVTRPIENALIKARTSALQQEQLRSQQQPFARGRPLAAPYRETPTPPGLGRPPSQAPPGYLPNYNQQQQYPPPGVGQQQYPPGVGQQYPPNGQTYPPSNNQPYPPAAYNQYPPTPQQTYPVGNTPQYPSNGQQYPPAAQQYPSPVQQYPPSVQQFSPPNDQPYQSQNQTQSYPPVTQQYPSYGNGNQPAGLPQRPPSQQYSQPPTQSWQPPQVYGAPDNSVEMLNKDISSLITSSKAEFAQNPWDSSIQTRLKALLDLQTILSSQQLPTAQIALIKNQVAQLSEAAQSSTHKVASIQPTPPQVSVVAAQPPAQQPSLNSLLGPGALAALLGRQSATPQQTPQAIASIRSPPPQPPSSLGVPSLAPSTSTPIPDAGGLLERLRAAGILGSAAATNTPTLPLNGLANKLPNGFPPSFHNTPPNNSRTPLADIPNDVVLKAASLKLPRSHLISELYEKLGAPCNQCGRRFHADEGGKKKKAAHLDWHFQSAHRLADAVMRGQHRSWYVDELDWIKSREVDPDQPPSENTNGSGAASLTATKEPKAIYLPVPDDPELKNAPCPICQEKFVSRWLDDEQDFVWMDAKQVGERIFHSSCHEEAYGGKAQARVKRDTPEPSVLGKRKAEEEHVALRTKIKMEVF